MVYKLIINMINFKYNKDKLIIHTKIIQYMIYM